MAEQEFRHLVRIVNTDLNGGMNIVAALRKIKGVGFALANATCMVTGVDKAKRTGDLSDDEIKKLDDAIRNAAQGLPAWMLNRRKDFETGYDKHVVTSELDFAGQEDVRRMQRIRCYKGVRHSMGLPVRGQRTRSNFRKNKGKVLGVIKKRIMAQKAAGDKEDKKEKKEKK